MSCISGRWRRAIGEVGWGNKVLGMGALNRLGLEEEIGWATFSIFRRGKLNYVSGGCVCGNEACQVYLLRPMVVEITQLVFDCTEVVIGAVLHAVINELDLFLYS